jgi:tetratricopeptide (TPR) repeat protein
MRAARKLLGRAHELLPSDSAEALELVPQLCDALVEVGEPLRAAQLVRTGLEQATARGDARIEAHLQLAALECDLGIEWEARLPDVAAAAIEVFERHDDARGQALATRMMGDRAWVRGEVADAVDLWRRSEALSHRAGDVSEAAGRRAWATIAAYFGHEPATRLLTTAAEALETVQTFPAARAQVLWVLAGAHAMRRDLARAEEAYLESARIQEQLGRAWSGIHYGAQVQADVYRFCDRPADEVRALREGTEQADAVSDEPNYLLRARLAEALARSGLDEESLTVAGSALEAGVSLSSVPALHARATVLARRRELADALDAAWQALEVLAPTGYYWLTGVSHLTLALVQHRAGHPRDARTSALAALERFEHKGIEQLTGEARQALRLMDA